MQRYDFAAPNFTRMVVPAGAFFLLAEAEAPVTITIYPVDGIAQVRDNVLPGYRWTGRRFSKIEITSSVASQSVAVISGDQVEGYTAGPTLVQQMGAQLKCLPDVNITSGTSNALCGPDATQRGLYVRATGSGILRIGDSTVGPGNGHGLSNGQNFFYEGQGQVYGYAEGANMTAAVTKLAWNY